MVGCLFDDLFVCVVDGLLFEKVGFVGSYDLKSCALVSVYVYSFVILKTMSGCFVKFVIVVQRLL